MAFSLTAACKRLMMPTSPGVEIVGARKNVLHPVAPRYQVLSVTPFQTSRACASSLRRVNALRGTLNSRIPLSSLRPHVRSASACLARSAVAKSGPSRRSKEEAATAVAVRRRARTTGGWTVSRIFHWAAGMHMPVRRVLTAGGRMFEFLFAFRSESRKAREMQ